MQSQVKRLNRNWNQGDFSRNWVNLDWKRLNFNCDWGVFNCDRADL